MGRPTNQHETPLTDQLEEALAFFRRPLSWTHNPQQSDPIVKRYSRIIMAARKAAKGPRVKPDALIVRQLAEFDRMMLKEPWMIKLIGQYHGTFCSDDRRK
jgi:hypothetical protein